MVLGMQPAVERRPEARGPLEVLGGWGEGQTSWQEMALASQSRGSSSRMAASGMAAMEGQTGRPHKPTPPRHCFILRL